MAIRKYAGDYRVEYTLSEDGKQRPHRVYQGKYYCFLREPRGVAVRILLAVSAVAVLLLPLLWQDSYLSRTAMVILPAGFAAIPLYLLLAAARRLRNSPPAFTREHRDKTQTRFLRASISLAVLLSAACVGCWFRGAAEELEAAVCLHLALLPAGYLLTQQKRLRTKPVEEQDTFSGGKP